MKYASFLILLLSSLLAVAGPNPVTQTTYSTNTQVAADAYVEALPMQTLYIGQSDGAYIRSQLLPGGYPSIQLFGGTNTEESYLRLGATNSTRQIVLDLAVGIQYKNAGTNLFNADSLGNVMFPGAATISGLVNGAIINAFTLTNGYIGATLIQPTLSQPLVSGGGIWGGGLTVSGGLSASGGITNTGSGWFSGNAYGLTNVQGAAMVTPTNALTTAPNFALVNTSLATNQNFALQPAVNASPTAYNSLVIDITNSSGSLITITPPTGWKVEGTWNITNETIISLYAPGNRWTNAVAYPLW